MKVGNVMKRGPKVAKCVDMLWLLRSALTPARTHIFNKGPVFHESVIVPDSKVKRKL